ncbi:uncharacterized protein LOC124897133 [Capsicum annuum]|uniref:uncharacterized protein LOC124897133 n=1 Tax=Capsicum annuum TaxID=4072 RepID=UPI001FB08F16|nr:uncharacterized protein LOC124897133 [Capsicum annuum]
MDRVLRLVGLRTVCGKVTKLFADKAAIILLLVICWAPSSKIPGSPYCPAPVVRRPWQFEPPEQQLSFVSRPAERTREARLGDEVILVACLIEGWIILDDLLPYRPLCAYGIQSLEDGLPDVGYL